MNFGEVFTQMSWIVILLLVLTIGFAIAEGLIPGFGVCGIMSILCGASTLVLEGIFTKSVFAVLIMLVLMIVIGLILFSIFIFSAKKGFLRKTAIVESQSAVPENYGVDEDKKLLVGRVGVVTSQCKPIGKADFEGKTYTIICRNGNAAVGSLIFVEEIRDNLVFVKLLKGGDNE